MRTSVDVHNFLQDKGIAHEIVLLDGEARDAAHAAALCGLKLQEMAETHIWEADGTPVAVVAPGGGAVSADRIATLLGAKECRPLDRRAAALVSDYAPGAVPPVAHKTPTTLVVDAQFAQAHCLYASAGEHGAVLKVRLNDLVERAGARIARVTKTD